MSLKHQNLRASLTHSMMYTVLYRQMHLNYMAKMEKWMKSTKTAVEALRQARGTDIVLEDDAHDWSHCLPLESKEKLELFDKRLADKEFRNRVVSLTNDFSLA